MKIKILCSCGTKYEFEAAPAGGRLPEPVFCPVCGLEGTAAAEAVLQQHAFAAPGPPIPASPQTSAPGTGPQPLRIHASQPAASAPAVPTSEAAEQPVEFCYKHPREVAVEHCRVCARPVCAECMEKFGYVCSVFCLEQARQRRLEIPVYENQRAVVQNREWAKTRRWLIAAGIAACALIGVWIWYAFYASEPHLVRSIKFNPAPLLITMTGPGELFEVRGQTATLYEMPRHKSRWSVPLPRPARTELIAARRTSRPDLNRGADDLTKMIPTRPEFAKPWDSDDDDVIQATARVTPTRIWVVMRDSMIAFDRKTGAVQHEVPLKQPVLEVTTNEQIVATVSPGDAGARIVTRVNLETADAQSAIVPQRSSVGMKTAAARERSADPDDDFFVESERENFVPTGASVALFESHLVERRIVAYQAMRAQDKPALRGNLTAAGSLGAAVDLLNEMKRQGPGAIRHEDESVYQVKLTRLFQPSSRPWSGSVTGSPSFYAGNNIDLLAAGKTVVAFDKENQKIWESKLTYPVTPASDQPRPPFLETSDALFFHDQGVLTCFELRTGQVRWRLPSVGVSQVQTDSAGALYVATTSADPDSVKYSEDLRLDDKIFPLLLKVEPKTGKVLWKLEKYAQSCLISGKYLYTTRSGSSGLDRFNASVHAERPQVHFHLYRINPADGKVIWDFHRPKNPEAVEIHGRQIFLRFRDEGQVLKYFSF